MDTLKLRGVMINQRCLLFFFLFVIFLSWGVYTNGWYEKGLVTVKGIAKNGKADLGLFWDAGTGLNNYQSNRFMLNVPYNQNSRLQHVRISSIGEKHPGSEGTSVSLIKIFLDGKEFDLKKVRPRSILRDRLAIQLTPDNPVFEFDAVVRKHVQIVFGYSFYFGKVAVEINGTKILHDLFSGVRRYDERPYDFYLLQPDGSFEFETEIPRYRIQSLILENRDPKHGVVFGDITLCGENECKILRAEEEFSKGNLKFHDPNKWLKRYFDLKRFCFRVFFAFVNAVLFTWLIGLAGRQKNILSLFFHPERRVFWGISLSFFILNFIVLIPFWPGIMSPDSLFIWRASGLPEVYINSHPILNQIYYMYLRGLWNNPAIVPITQIMLSAILAGFIFNSIIRRGVSFWLLLPWIILYFCSLPILLYNTALWKDIPFALLVTVWGMYFVYANRREKGTKQHFSLSLRCIFLGAYLCLCFFRHNGLVYLAVVPLFWLISHRYNVKKGILYLILLLTVASAFYLNLKHLKSTEGFGFLATAVEQHTLFLRKTDFAKEVKRIKDDYFQIFDMNKEGTVSDKYHYYLADRYAFDFFKKTELFDYYRYEKPPAYLENIKKKILELYHASYLSPWEYIFWNPVHMLCIVLLSILLYRFFPSAAIFSAFLLCGILPLLVLNIFNWRYYYFFFHGLYFVVPLILLDVFRRKGGCY